MNLIAAIVLFATASVAGADAFDDWAAQHNSGKPLTVMATDEPKLWLVPGKMHVLNRNWNGKSGLARIAYEYGNSQIHIQYIGVDTTAEGRIEFITWTHLPRQRSIAEYGQAADVATTAAALSFGLVEMNPLLVSNPALMAAGVLKLAAVPMLKAQSIKVCQENLGPISSIGWAAAAWNIAALAGLGPAGVLPALVVGIATLPDDNEKFWACVPEES